MPTINSLADLTVPESYCVLNADGDITGRIRLTSVDDHVGYGVDHTTGERVVLRPLPAYINNDRLRADCA